MLLTAANDFYQNTNLKMLLKCSLESPVPSLRLKFKSLSVGSSDGACWPEGSRLPSALQASHSSPYIISCTCKSLHASLALCVQLPLLGTPFPLSPASEFLLITFKINGHYLLQLRCMANLWSELPQHPKCSSLTAVPKVHCSFPQQWSDSALTVIQQVVVDSVLNVCRIVVAVSTKTASSTCLPCSTCSTHNSSNPYQNPRKQILVLFWSYNYVTEAQ